MVLKFKIELTTTLGVLFGPISHIFELVGRPTTKQGLEHWLQQKLLSSSDNFLPGIISSSLC